MSPAVTVTLFVCRTLTSCLLKNLILSKNTEHFIYFPLIDCKCTVFMDWLQLISILLSAEWHFLFLYYLWIYEFIFESAQEIFVLHLFWSGSIRLVAHLASLWTFGLCFCAVCVRFILRHIGQTTLWVQWSSVLLCNAATVTSAASVETWVRFWLMSSVDVRASVITRVVYSKCLFVCVHGGTFMVWLTGVYVSLCHI